MKLKIYSIFCLLLFLSSTCKKESDDCHYSISIKNNTNKEIIAAIPLNNSNNKCRLDGKIINSASVYDYRPFNFCIENSLTRNAIMHIYIVDTKFFNDSNIYYNCDSIEIQNKVLKHYVLTLEDLKRDNFTIVYNH